MCDSGVGLAAEQLPRLFEMFAQVNPGGSRARGGLGIGLFLAQRLIQMHGGTIEAQSNGLGQGSCFTLRLPLAPHCCPRDAAESLGTLLGFLGSEVRVVHDGASALAALEEWPPSVLLLDLGMPDMDGYEVARRIRAEHRNDSVLLVALTGWGQRQDRDRTVAAGFDHHLIKPVDFAGLAALLTRHLERKSKHI